MSTDAGAALTKLIEQLTARHGPEPADPSADLCPNGCDGPLHELVYSFMLWEASHELAGGAVSGLLEAFVDYNELRICYPEEMVPALGAKYPRAEERCARLHAALHDIFVRENGVSLARLRDQGKRDARAFLGALEGVPGFVAARVAVVSLGAHAFPVDDRISAILLGAGVGEEDTSNDELSGRLERLLRAGEALPAYLVLEAEAGTASADKPKAKTRRTKSSKSKTGTSR